MNKQKKAAPKAATLETASRKTFSINSILKNGGKVNIVVKRPGEIPQIIGAYDIPPEFLSKKLRCETLGTRFALIYDPKSYERMNISFGRTIYRGNVLIVNLGFHKLYQMSIRDTDDAFVWLMHHRV